MTSFHNLYGCLAMYVKVKGELIKVIIIYHLYLLVTIRDDFHSADPCSMQDAFHIRTQLNDLTLYEFSWLSGESAHTVLGDHGLNSCRGLWIFLCSMVMPCWSVHLSHWITELKIQHLYTLITILQYRFLGRGGVTSWILILMYWLQPVCQGGHNLMRVIGGHQLSLKLKFQCLGQFVQHSLSGQQHTLQEKLNCKWGITMDM